MALFIVLIRSNHQDGDCIDHFVQVEYPFVQAPRTERQEIDWPALNSMLLSESFVKKVKDAMTECKIEVHDPDYWTSEAYVTAIDNEKIPDDYDLFLIEDRIMTGDLM